MLLNQGDGTFAAPVDYLAGVSTHSIVAADVDGDGIDLSSSASSATASRQLLQNEGSGVFGAATDHAAGAAPFFVTAADPNADGRPDPTIPSVTLRTTSACCSPASCGP